MFVYILNVTLFFKAFTEIKGSVRFLKKRFSRYKILGWCHLIILPTRFLTDKSHVLVILSHVLLKKKIASKNNLFSSTCSSVLCCSKDSFIVYSLVLQAIFSDLIYSYHIEEPDKRKFVTSSALKM